MCCDYRIPALFKEINTKDTVRRKRKKSLKTHSKMHKVEERTPGFFTRRCGKDHRNPIWDEEPLDQHLSEAAGFSSSKRRRTAPSAALRRHLPYRHQHSHPIAPRAVFRDQPEPSRAAKLKQRLITEYTR